MKIRDIIERSGTEPLAISGLMTLLGLTGRTALLDAEAELHIGREEGQVVLTLDGRVVLSTTFEALEGYVNGPADDRSGLAGDGSGLTGSAGVASTGALYPCQPA